MNDVISTIPELEACVGAAGLPIKMKIIDHLDAEAARWIAAAPLGFVAAGGRTVRAWRWPAVRPASRR